MSKNIFQRVVNLDSIKDRDIAGYTPSELVAFLTTAYPNDPIGALRYMTESYKIGSVLSSQALLLLEGLESVKTDKSIQ